MSWYQCYNIYPSFNDIYAHSTNSVLHLSYMHAQMFFLIHSYVYTEEGRNLLKSPTVTVDPLLHTITSAPSMGTFGPPKAIIADTLLNLTPPVPSDVINAPAQGIIRPGGLNRSGFGHGTRNAVSTVTVTLDSLYLINCLKLNAYPDVTTEMQHQQKSFSYTIQISRDNRNWVELFNYRNYTCLATQDLSFPTQAVRYV